jgi:hypothetical protein
MKPICFSDFDFYIIHIKGSNRYQNLYNEFQKVQINIENNSKIHFIDGIIPDTRYNYKRKGVYGVALGHFNAIQKSLENNNPYSFIIEDDVMFLDNCIENINLTFSNLYKNKEDYDIVQFRTPKFPCNNIDCKIIDNYIIGHCRFVPAEFIYLTKSIREKIVNNKEWFLSGAPIDVWYTNTLKCIKTIDNYTWQNGCLGSIKKTIR